MAIALDDILRSHHLRTPVVMGVLNVTPDSFSDGGLFLDPAAALAQARQMVEQGADIIDVGAESTRPGSQGVTAAEQISRLEPILAPLVELGVPISVDTTSAQVAKMALRGGAAIINDISAGGDDPDMFAVAAEAGAAMVLMHMLGKPRTMQEEPRYHDVVAQVRDFLAERLETAQRAGVRSERLIVDPGIGFGKTLEHNLQLLAGLGAIAELGRPVLVGVSRKRFIGTLTGRQEPAERLAGTLGAVVCSWQEGATIFRVHDVSAAREALAVAAAIGRASPTHQGPPDGPGR